MEVLKHFEDLLRHADSVLLRHPALVRLPDHLEKLIPGQEVQDEVQGVLSLTDTMELEDPVMVELLHDADLVEEALLALEVCDDVGLAEVLQSVLDAVDVGSYFVDLSNVIGSNC